MICKIKNCNNKVYEKEYCRGCQGFRSDEEAVTLRTKKKTSRKAKTKPKKKLKRGAKPRLIPLPKLDKLCWKFTSLAFRLQDCDSLGYVNCCTCDKQMYYFGTRDNQLGHFQSRRKSKTKFLRRNMHSQCSTDNSPAFHGKPYEFGVFLNKKYGEGTAEKMIKLSRETYKHDRISLKRILLDMIYLLYEESNAKNLFDWKGGLLKQELQLYNDAIDKRYEDTEIVIGRFRIP